MIINDNVNNYLDVLELNNIGKKKLKKYSINSYDDAEKAASNFRKDNNINEIIPLADLCNIIENLGVYIVIVKNDNVYYNNQKHQLMITIINVIKKLTVQSS